MIAPDVRSRPAVVPDGSEVTTTTTTASVPQGTDTLPRVGTRPLCGPHLRRHFCYLDVKWRRRTSAELSRLCRHRRAS